MSLIMGLNMKNLLPILAVITVLLTSCNLEHVTDNYIEGEYVMPIGVPNPWVAPDVKSPDRPSIWENVSLINPLAE